MSQISPLPASQGQSVTPVAPSVTQPALASAPPSAPAPAPAPAPESNQRLMIQESGELGVFIYTIMDRATGQVINQIPFTAAVDMGQKPDYAAGQVINTKA
jgi:hypothetical protein